MKRTVDAANWAIRRALGPLSAGDQQSLDDWLAEDPRREGALMQAQVTLAFAERAQALMPQRSAGARVSRRHALVWSAAAVTAGAAAVWLVPFRDHLTTEVGQIRRTRLADTSVVTLNTQSSVTVDLERQERRLSLDRGEAWFQVAHDTHRPFVVSAADLRVQAVGTAFSVRRMNGGVDVLVTDGVVEVWRADRPTDRTRVVRDHRVFVPDDSASIAPISASASIQRALAWRTGRLSLAGETLDYAVSEINRYNATQIRVDSPLLGRAPIYGFFRLNDPTEFAQLVAASEGARVEADGDNLRLIPKVS